MNDDWRSFGVLCMLAGFIMVLAVAAIELYQRFGFGYHRAQLEDAVVKITVIPASNATFFMSSKPERIAKLLCLHDTETCVEVSEDNRFAKLPDGQKIKTRHHGSNILELK